jgi:hypothetical protein
MVGGAEKKQQKNNEDGEEPLPEGVRAKFKFYWKRYWPFILPTYIVVRFEENKKWILKKTDAY